MFSGPEVPMRSQVFQEVNTAQSFKMCLMGLISDVVIWISSRSLEPEKNTPWVSGENLKTSVEAESGRVFAEWIGLVLPLHSVTACWR